MAEVVLVHGLFYRSWSMRPLARRFRTAGHRVHAFSYPTLSRNPEINAQALGKFCRENIPETAHFVGHSLGGLVILAMLRQEHRIRPGRVVFLGTSLNGSLVARRLRKFKAGSGLMGRAGGLLTRGLLPTPGAAEYGMIAGTAGRGLGRLTGPFAGPGDGTVSIAETRSEALSDRCDLPVGHTGLLFSAEAARQAAYFIETGRFDRT